MVDIGAAGFVGIALEPVAGTYTAPTKFFPIRSESLAWTQGTNWRRVIRGVVDPIGAVEGDGHIEGDLDTELLDDMLPYLLLCARGDLTKTGAGAPFTYEFIPNAKATPDNTMSVTVVRAGEAFGYSGVVVASMSFGVDNGMATSVYSLLGNKEAGVAVPGDPAYSADDKPFGAGTWNIQIPTPTQVFDVDNFSLEIEDNGEPQNRLKNELGAQFIKYGERTVTLSVDRDFENRTEYNAFKALTSKAVLARVARGANRIIEFEVPAAIIDTYDVGLGGVGDLVRASIAYQGVHDAATGGGYRIEVTTDEDVDIPE